MNLPNKLTVLRVIMIPFFVLFMLTDLAGAASKYIALAIFCVASFTDFLDGYIARKNNLITSFGKFIDPIADKMLVNTMMIMFACMGMVPVVPVIVMVWRDTIVDGLRMSTASKGVVVAAGMLGKIKTVSQMVTIILVLLNNF